MIIYKLVKTEFDDKGNAIRELGHIKLNDYDITALRCAVEGDASIVSGAASQSAWHMYQALTELQGKK